MIVMEKIAFLFGPTRKMTEQGLRKLLRKKNLSPSDMKTARGRLESIVRMRESEMGKAKKKAKRRLIGGVAAGAAAGGVGGYMIGKREK